MWAGNDHSTGVQYFKHICANHDTSPTQKPRSSFVKRVFEFDDFDGSDRITRATFGDSSAQALIVQKTQPRLLELQPLHKGGEALAAWIYQGTARSLPLGQISMANLDGRKKTTGAHINTINYLYLLGNCTNQLIVVKIMILNIYIYISISFFNSRTTSLRTWLRYFQSRLIDMGCTMDHRTTAKGITLGIEFELGEF